MFLDKIQAIEFLESFVPAGTDHRRAGMWLVRMGIDDDTTLEGYDRYETLLYGISQQGLTKTLFAVLDTKRVYSLGQFEKLVDELHTGRWVLDEDIKSEAQLHYYLTHNCEEKPTPDMPLEELFCGNVEPFRAIEMLEEQKRWEQGGLSCYGWVYYEEA